MSCSLLFILLLNQSGTYVGSAFFMMSLLPFQKEFDGLYVVLADCVEERVRHVYPAVQQHFDQLVTLIFDGNDQRGSTQRVRTVDVEIPGTSFVLFQETIFTGKTKVC